MVPRDVKLGRGGGSVPLRSGCFSPANWVGRLIACDLPIIRNNSPWPSSRWLVSPAHVNLWLFKNHLLLQLLFFALLDEELFWVLPQMIVKMWAEISVSWRFWGTLTSVPCQSTYCLVCALFLATRLPVACPSIFKLNSDTSRVLVFSKQVASPPVVCSTPSYPHPLPPSWSACLLSSFSCSSCAVRFLRPRFDYQHPSQNRFSLIWGSARTCLTFWFGIIFPVIGT